MERPWTDLTLRAVDPDDLPAFFAHQQDPKANHMAAFTTKDPSDWDAFLARWTRQLRDETVLARTVVVDGEVAGHISSYEELGATEVTYWIDRPLWGRGIATAALTAFLEQQPIRPLHARAAQDNTASLRVLQHCGFTIVGSDRGHANARATEIDEHLLELP